MCKLPDFDQYSLNYELGYFYLHKLNEPKKTIALFHGLLSLSASPLPVGNIIESYNILSSAYLADNNPVEAVKYAEISKSMIDTLDDVNLSVVRTTYQDLALGKSALGEWKDAYEYRTKADNLADSLTRKREKELATFAIVGREVENNERELVEKRTKPNSRRESMKS